MRREDEGISAGRFVTPQANRILPPARTYRMQSGRFVEPTADMILPPVREVQIESRLGIDYENSYHFGGIANNVRGINRKA